MTLEELEKKLTEIDDLRKETDDLRAELVAQIAELKAQNEEMPTPPHPRWKPSNADTYYMIGTCGDVCIQDWTGINNEIDKSRLSFGNVFNTRAEAKFAVERLKVLAEMREWAGNCFDPYDIIYNYSADMVIPNMDSDIFVHGNIRFASCDAACNCIKAVGKDRLKKYYFGIPELHECCASES